MTNLACPYCMPWSRWPFILAVFCRPFLPRCMECRRGLTIYSICTSVCQTRDLWQNERRLCPHSYTTERIFTLVLWQEEWLVGVTPSTRNFASTGPRWCEIADFQPIFARIASAVTPSEKSSINTNRKSTTRFPMSLSWSSYVAEKRQTAVFRLKSHFAWRKSIQSYFVWKVSATKL